MKEKTLITMFVLIALLCAQAVGKTIYVDDDAGGLNDGSSWENAYVYLQDALADAGAASGQVEILVAKGIYKPDQGAGQTPGDREATFLLINDVNIVGGYAGLDSDDPNARDAELYKTILSGDLNSDDAEITNSLILLFDTSRDENSYHVVTGSGIDETAILNGFVITAGNASDVENNNKGGGLYIDNGSPSFTDCTFSLNVAANYGGAMYINGDSNDLTMADCVLIGNVSQEAGGAIYANNSDGVSLTNCLFSINFALDNGGAVYTHNSSNFIITDCSFSLNAAGDYGGGVYNYYSDVSINDSEFVWNISLDQASGIYNYYCDNVSISNCTISENESDGNGSGIYNRYCDNVSISNCTISENESDGSGSGIYNYHSDSVLTECTFSKNKSSSNGGGIYNSYSSPVLTGCIFRENTAANGAGLYDSSSSDSSITNCTFNNNASTSDGGGIYSYGDISIDNCTFNNNTARYGGGIYSYNYDNTISNCTFTGNRATYTGGGIYNRYNDNSTLTNCTFSGNTAGDDGGGIYNYSSSGTFTNCSFSGNSASSDGGGICNYYNCNFTLVECKFSGNISGNDGGGIHNYSNSNIILRNCSFNGNSGVNRGGGICNYSYSTSTLSNCKFDLNMSRYGSGVYNYNQVHSLTNCKFRNNIAISGSGVYSYTDSNSILTQCTFKGNIAGYDGSGIYSYRCEATLSNCLFSGNSAFYRGGAINIVDDCNLVATNCTFQGNLSPNGNSITCSSTQQNLLSLIDISNSILWGNNQLWNSDGSVITVSYSDVKRDLDNVYDPYEQIIFVEGNIDCDPCFVDPGYWNENGTLDDSADDFWVDGDYHLKSQAGHWDPVSQSWVLDDVTSFCIDAGDPVMPIGLEPSPNGGRVNMGAYGGTAEASMSIYDVDFFPKAFSPEPTDGAVDVLLDVILSWQSDPNAVMHEVYFGTAEEPPFIIKQCETRFNPGPLEPNTVYYWSIDDIDNLQNRTTGDTWTFTTGYNSTRVSRPNPADGDIDVELDTILSWSPGLDDVLYDVYLGRYSSDVSEASIINPMGVLVSPGQDSNSYDPPGSLLYNQVYYWRVDEIDSGGITTKGNVWTFVTEDYSGKGRACFTGQTPVWIDGETVEISKAAIGQSIDGIGKVEEIQEHEGTFALYDILLENGNCITVANNHIFMVESGDWISLHNLKAGERLKIQDGSVVILSITKQPELFEGKVYNLKIAGSEKYMVGEDAVIVRDY